MRRVRFRSFVRLFTSGRASQRLQYFSFAFLGVSIFFVVLFFSIFALGTLREAPGGEELVARVPGGLLTLASVALVFVGVAAAVRIVYLSQDIEVLSAMPVRERTILAYKFWETLLGNSTFFVAFALPVLVAYGVVTGASALYYVLLPVVSVLVLMLPTGLCLILVMPLMRILPAGKAGEIVAALGLLAGAALYAAWFWFTSPSRTAEASADPFRTLAGSPLLTLPPGNWAGEALAGAATFAWGRLFGGLLPLAASALVLYFGCLALTGWAYATGRARAAEGGGKVRSAGWTTGLFGPLPRDARAVAAKDLAVLPRDLRRLALLLFPALMLVAALSASFFGGPFGGGPSIFPYLTAGSVAVLVAFQGGLQSVGAEGRSYWMLAAAPISPMRLLLGKWAANVLASVGAATVGVLGAALLVGFYLPGLLLGFVAGVLGGMVVALYSVGISALFPRFDWENPNQVTTPLGGFLAAGCLFGLAISGGLAVALAFALSAVIPLPLAVAGTAVLWAAVAAVVGYAVFAAGAARLGKMDWEL